MASVPPQPFVWGKGGKRLTPDQVEMQRRMGMQQSRTDYSPVDHWTQGLGRVADGILGGLSVRNANRAGEANAAESDAVMQALMAGMTGEGATPDRAAVIGAMGNRYVTPEVRDMAGQVWERMNPKAVQPTEFERQLQNANIMPGTPEYIEANRRAAMAKGDPQVTLTLPNGQVFIGPQSELATFLQGGGDQTSTAAPATLPPDFSFDGPPTMANTPSPALGANGNPSVLTAAQYQAVVAKKGKAETDAWAARNGIRIEGR